MVVSLLLFCLLNASKSKKTLIQFRGHFYDYVVASGTDNGT